MLIKTPDLVILAIYFSLMLFLGFWLGRRKKTAEDYFLAGRKAPGWAVGLSILGTCISSVTYVAYPGMAFARDWQYLTQGFALVFLVAVGFLAVVPFYRRYVRMSVTEYMEARFSLGLRIYSLLALLIFELTRLATIMYLVSLVISTITGMEIALVILLVGVVTIIYTVAGGMEGVIWSDVIQTLVLFAGGILAVIYASLEIPEGFFGIIKTASAQGKFHLFDFSWDFTRAGFWVLFLSGLVNFFYFLCANQNQVQRYQCAVSDQQAKKATLIGSLGSVPVWALFMLVGTSLFVYFHYHPDPQVQEFINQGKPDKVFPYFIARVIPTGLSGLLLAGLFSAAMSTLDSSMTTLSTLAITDLYFRFFPAKDEKKNLLLSRALMLFWGIFGMGIALAMIKVGTFLEFYFRLFSILGGSIVGLFALGLFSKTAHSRGAWLGVAVGLVITFWGSLSYPGINSEKLAGLKFPWEPMMIGVIATGGVIILGWLFSVILPRRKGEFPPEKILQDFWKQGFKLRGEE